eukprot:TRINITY_DN10399_c0_g1_i1.p1 TRINITY_DN10399_c0_g1~~TRINITY_DN10399_c0_g1_i1.p1  ORF type:complete len:374 (-),score=71.37 TRINITY_DN10399_c0_g1_i1:93-1214(-)
MEVDSMFVANFFIEYWWVSLVAVLFLVLWNAFWRNKTTEEDTEKKKVVREKRKKEPKEPKEKEPELYKEHPRFLKYYQLMQNKFGLTYGAAGTLASTNGKDCMVFNDKKSTNYNAEKAIVTAIGWSPDGKVLAQGLSPSKDIRLQVSQRVKKDYPTGKLFAGDINIIEFSPDGRFLMVGSSESTEIKFLTLEAQLITSFNTNQMRNNMACFSPDGRFVSVACFTSESRIWELVYKNDALTAVKKVMDLKGHKRSITALSFYPNSKQIVSASKDASWKVWRIDVRYATGEDPECILSISTPSEINTMKLSPNGKIVALANNQGLVFYSFDNGEILETIESPNNQPITHISWSLDMSKIAVTNQTGVFVYKPPTV